MKQSEITVRVKLGRGDAAATGLDLRPVARLRDHQRRLPFLNPALTAACVRCT